MACVKDTEDAAAISHAKANDVPIAVRGGGANPFGKSSVEDGLVIDLSRHLSLVRIDAEARLAYVGGGAVWKDVDTAAIKHGLATVGATVNHVSCLRFPGAAITQTFLFYQTGVGGCVFCLHSLCFEDSNQCLFVRTTLHGGYGWLSGRHGLVIDNLRQVSPGTVRSNCERVSETSILYR